MSYGKYSTTNANACYESIISLTFHLELMDDTLTDKVNLLMNFLHGRSRIMDNGNEILTYYNTSMYAFYFIIYKTNSHFHIVYDFASKITLGRLLQLLPSQDIHGLP